jgi:hypothetical protein
VVRDLVDAPSGLRNESGREELPEVVIELAGRRPVEPLLELLAAGGTCEQLADNVEAGPGC